MFDSPPCYAVGLYLLQEDAELAFVLAAQSDHAKSQAGSFWFVQLEESTKSSGLI